MAGFLSGWNTPANPLAPAVIGGEYANPMAALGGIADAGGRLLPNYSAPAIAPASTPGSFRLGANMDTANLALSGLGTLGGLWAAFKAQKLAQKQFDYTRKVTDTNLANQTQIYNTGITDRANNRAIVEGRTPAETRAYIDTNSLRRYGA